MTILNKKTLTGLTNQFDDDAEETFIQYNIKMENDVFFEYITQEEEPIAKSIGPGISGVPELADSVSKKHKNRPLGEKQQTEEIINSENVEFSFEKNDNWKKYTPQQLQTPKSSPLTFPLGEEINLSSQTGKTPTRNPSHRRPAIIVKPMTSSHIAKRYDMLLDKRIQLVDTQLTHMVKENNLILQKRKLEVEILEIELKNKKDRVSA